MAYRRVLITGASAGFGKASAQLLHQEGYEILATARRLDRLEELKAACQERIHIYQLDVSKRHNVQRLAEELKAADLMPDVVINNAGLALGLEPADACSLDDWEQMVDVNIKGLLYITHFFLPAMKAANHGYIVNIGSIAGSWPYPQGNVYAASKAFVNHFSRLLRCDLHGSKVRVSCIEPGLCKTEFSEVRFRGDKERSENVYRGTDPILPEDIARTISWLLNQPPQVNVNAVELMATCQSWAPYAIHRRPAE